MKEQASTIDAENNLRRQDGRERAPQSVPKAHFCAASPKRYHMDSHRGESHIAMDSHGFRIALTLRVGL